MFKQAFTTVMPSPFPSPCGEKVGINGPMALMAFGYIFPGKFPSPCGEKVGINPPNFSYSTSFCVVFSFRPLAGKR